MARGGHGRPKVSPEPAMTYLSMPCGWFTSETALWSFQGEQPVAFFYHTRHPTPYAYASIDLGRISFAQQSKKTRISILSQVLLLMIHKQHENKYDSDNNGKTTKQQHRQHQQLQQ
jgi:hypothetical protein